MQIFLGSNLFFKILGICLTCELDIIPMEFLKKVLVHCIPVITKVVNLSLSMGNFFKDWKLAIIRPLIKSIKKGTEKSTTDQ